MNKEWSLPASTDLSAFIIVCDDHHGVLHDDFEFEMAMRFLPLEKQQRILSRKQRDARNNALCNQILQIAGTAMACGVHWRDLKFTVSKSGKPHVESANPCSFNLSNCCGKVAMFVKKGHKSIGIDLASTKDCENWGPDYLRLFQDIFSPAELECLEQTQQSLQQDRLFIHYWSLKEAYTKLTGTGLNCCLSSINLGALEPIEPDKTAKIVRTIESRDITFRSKWIDELTVLSVCEESECNAVEHAEIPLFELEVADVLSYLNSMK
ncbi:LAQU0S13e02278g1_1 [Lachancea quebecensis]|uniref:holo-[acyl-carrier-protein] synthase n=1 Tax=Lachancea quebecensis TaxID=1654605 RepID=A0A0P1KVW5_9SACH|nr:LAQU0S13e02278g1_1 [Lachancea quebecensis]